MWTYLAIFLSISALLIIFGRKWVIFPKKDKGVKKPDKKIIDDDDGLPDEVKKVSRSDRDKVETLCKRGFNLVNAGKDDEAIKCFVQALAINEAHQETQHRLAVLYLQKQMYGAAAALFKKLGEITQDPIHFSHLGLALYRQSDFEGARDAYQRAVDLDPSRPQRFISLAQVYRSLGQLNHALVALNKALEIDKENLEFLFLLTDLQIESGNFAEAKEILERILEIDKNNKNAKALLSEVHKMESAD